MVRKEAQQFIDEVADIIQLLEVGNVDFQKTNRPNVFRCVLRKQITLFYYCVNEKTVELLRFWNNYQRPEKPKI